VADNSIELTKDDEVLIGTNATWSRARVAFVAPHGEYRHVGLQRLEDLPEDADVEALQRAWSWLPSGRHRQGTPVWMFVLGAFVAVMVFVAFFLHRLAPEHAADRDKSKTKELAQIDDSDPSGPRADPVLPDLPVGEGGFVDPRREERQTSKKSKVTAPIAASDSTIREWLTRTVTTVEEGTQAVTEHASEVGRSLAARVSNPAESAFDRANELLMRFQLPKEHESKIRTILEASRRDMLRVYRQADELGTEEVTKRITKIRNDSGQAILDVFGKEGAPKEFSEQVTPN
jgi:hypothetical protein